MNTKGIDISANELSEITEASIQQALIGLRLMPQMVSQVQTSALQGNKQSAEILRRYYQDNEEE